MVEINPSTVQTAFDMASKKEKRITAEIICEYKGLDPKNATNYTKVGMIMKDLGYVVKKMKLHFYVKGE